MRLNKPKFWDDQKISFWSILLFPFSIIYLITFFIIKILKKKLFHYNCPIPIICVGNIYVGGTGKTPLAIEIFKFVKSNGYNPAFIKKDYDYLMDEARMLKETGEIFQSSNRKAAIDLSIKNRHNVAILDDGFQDFSIEPNFSILCFNSKQLIGNGFVIPSGPLRDRLSSIKKADCIIINGNKNDETLNFESKISRNFKNKKFHFFYSNYKIKNIKELKNAKITAFAGIGNPSNFFDLLKENNLNVKKTYSFPDHHSYSRDDFKEIIKNKSLKIVTTEKDYYRLDDIQKENCEYIDVDYEIENLDKLKKIIKSYI